MLSSQMVRYAAVVAVITGLAFAYKLMVAHRAGQPLKRYALLVLCSALFLVALWLNTPQPKLSLVPLSLATALILYVRFALPRNEQSS